MGIFRGFVQYMIVCSYSLEFECNECYLVLYRKFSLMDLTLWLPYTLALILLDIMTGTPSLSWKIAKRTQKIEDAVQQLIYLQNLTLEDQFSYISLLENKFF